MSDQSAFDTIEVLDTKILFQFEDEIDANNKNAFHETRESGIILQSNFDQSTKLPRWVRVIKVGPDVCDDIEAGSRVLVEAMKWTPQSTYKGEKFARTEEKFILAIDD